MTVIITQAKIAWEQKLHEFFPWLKVESEKKWENLEIDTSVYGFQLQKGTTWLPGLTEEQITDYENVMGFPFPEIYRIFLRYMNGTDKEMVNIYGESGEPYTYGVGYYSYPRDVQAAKEAIDVVCEAFAVTQQELGEKGIPHIMPIESHRFLIMDQCETNSVLSMHGNDVVPYADCLNNFLFHSILLDSSKDGQQPNIPDFQVPFWLE